MTIELPFVVVPLDLGTITAGNETAAQPAEHLNEFKTIGVTWRTSSATSVWVRGDFGSEQEIDFCSMLAANALPGTTIRLRLGTTQAEVDGTAPYDSGVLDFIDPSRERDDATYSSHLEIASVQSYRWWRVDIGGHTGAFEAAALVLGKKLTPANYYSPNFEYGVEDLGAVEFGRYGVVDETPGLVMRTLAFRFGWLSEEDFETMFRPMVKRLGRRGVALWCLDPQESVYRQDKTYFGWIRNPIVARHVLNTTDGPRFQKEFEILSMV